ncbi:hypothetical protein [Vibrio gallaecicus]|nr:hypothetical protein [Vibrio gallaecicus]MDN3615771.1 hypothetical protein [Vibrio gallaecicus]MDN3615897.1 hypothetical protein [Vibrio gallaecicus]MDN3617737.1 hypothetical protein [Vibrio gallaecicus]
MKLAFIRTHFAWKSLLSFKITTKISGGGLGFAIPVLNHQLLI